MQLAPSLRQRHLRPEVMDDPALDAGQHHHALDALARINWLSASARILWPAIRRLCRQRRKDCDPRPVRVLDIATGGGDVPVRLWQKARRRGFALEVTGCDFSSVALEHARRHAERSGADIRFFALDALAKPIPGSFDILTCSLFLHHLDEQQALLLLKKMRESTGKLALVNDLARGPAGWWAAYLGSRILTRSPVVHIDALLSVEGALTPAEALALAQQAGWNGATVGWRFPFRYLLTWRRP